MLRISKLADYAAVIMRHIADQNTAVSAAQVAQVTHIALPTVRKVLKLLLNAQLLASTRGVSGGYILSKPANQISLTDVIEAIDGPIAMTDCVNHDRSCEHTERCVIKSHWVQVNNIITAALDATSLRSTYLATGLQDVDT